MSAARLNRGLAARVRMLRDDPIGFPFRDTGAARCER